MSARPPSTYGHAYESGSSSWEADDELGAETDGGELTRGSWVERQIERSLRQPSSEPSDSYPGEEAADDVVEELLATSTPETAPAKVPEWGLCRPWKRHLLAQMAAEARQHHAQGEPLPLHLVPIIRFNIWHALAENATLLGMDSGWLYYESISPFNKAGPGLGPPALPACPASLRLTALQPSVEHHPWIDLLPFPALRENFLRQIKMHGEDSVDEDDMCRDIVEGANGGEVVVMDAATLIVWGNSWDPMGWEATVPFLRKWGWLFAGNNDILESTNYWRRRRGERELRF